MELDNVNFVCVYWGNKYDYEYVQKLYNMVQRNTTVKHNFIVYTENLSLKRKLEGNIEVRQLPHHDYEGWWNKLQLFSPEANLEGNNLFMDLDVVILENIDDMFNFGEDTTFGVINNFNLSTKIFNSSILKFNNKTATDMVWKPWLSQKGELKRLPGDQDVISKLVHLSPNLKIMPDEWSFSYKWFSRQKPRYSKSEWTFEKQPSAKVAVFHGQPNPHQSDQEWVKNSWK
jgi:hypothetical protein